MPDFAADAGRHRTRLSMLSVMPHPTTYQISHSLLQAVLRDTLLDVMGSAHGPQGIGRVGFGACAGLHSLLAAHPVDRQGRCRSCRGPGWLGHRRQVCMVFQKAHYWLRQPAHRL